MLRVLQECISVVEPDAPWSRRAIRGFTNAGAEVCTCFDTAFSSSFYLQYMVHPSQLRGLCQRHATEVSATFGLILHLIAIRTVRPQQNMLDGQTVFSGSCNELDDGTVYEPVGPRLVETSQEIRITKNSTVTRFPARSTSIDNVDRLIVLSTFPSAGQPPAMLPTMPDASPSTETNISTKNRPPELLIEQNKIGYNHCCNGCNRLIDAGIEPAIS